MSRLKLACPKCRSHAIEITEVYQPTLYVYAFDENGSLISTRKNPIEGLADLSASCNICKHVWTPNHETWLEFIEEELYD